MAATIQHEGAVVQSRRVHIALASEKGHHAVMTRLIDQHRARKIEAFKAHIERLCADPEVSGMVVASVMSDEVSRILKGYQK